MEDSMNPIFDLSYQEKRDNSIDSVNYIELFDTNGGFTAKNTPTVQRHFTFRLNDVNSWYRFAHSFIKVKCTAKSANDLTQSHIASDIRTIINRCIFRMNSEVVEDKPNYYFREAEWDRQTWSLDYINNVASNMGIDDHHFYGDGIRQAPQFSPNGNSVFAEGLGNLLIAKSEALSTGGAAALAQGECQKLSVWNNRLGCDARLASRDSGQGVEYLIPFYHLFNVGKVWDKCVKGCPLEIELFIADDGICCRSPNAQMDGTGAVNTATEGAVLNWVGSGITWMIPRIVPSPMAEARLNAQLLAGVSVPITFEKSYVYRFGIDSSVPRPSSQQWRIVNTASRPTRVVLFLRSQESETGAGGATGQFFGNITDGSNFNGISSVLTKANLFVNGRKVPSEDVKATAGTQKGKSASQGGDYDVATLPLGRDVSQLYRQYNEMQANYTEPYNRNFGMMSGTLNINDFSLTPYYCYDLSKRELAEFVGGASEISLDFTLDQSVGALATASMFIYAVVYTESEMTLNMTEHQTRVLVR